MGSLGFTADDTALDIDLDRLIGSHACIVANSGGGKSGLIRRLLEITHGHVQHIVLDVEDEFYTLREHFDYVIAGGDGGDAPATVAGAAGLARAALTHGFSLIVQLNDLGPDGAPAFVGSFLDSLITAPRELWRPVLIVLDEAQRFAPQDGMTEATHVPVAKQMAPHLDACTGMLVPVNSVKKAHEAMATAIGLPGNGESGMKLWRRSLADILRSRMPMDQWGEITMFLGHDQFDDVSDLYAPFRPDYLSRARAEIEAICDEIENRAPGAFYRNDTAEGGNVFSMGNAHNG
jgi:hypothetical protein